ncbi:hypothetical protein M0R45_037262 [Rubus argutus]|uniref:Reverse transcriptase Ty1/copia-type domain-containing protein n=1 Tax=Rubus argutus TaxID=59490 RepID=A0AAW1W2C2_RUBAR
MVVEPEQDIALAIPPPEPRRSGRARRSAINTDDYVIYLQKSELDLGEDDDPVTFKQAVQSKNAEKWGEAMEAELKSMSDNAVWDLVEPTGRHKSIGCKWVFKTKRCADGTIERYKARLVAKGFTQKEGIDFNETFSPVSTKDAFRIIMALVAYFNMELHQMDVKTAFLNGDLEEENIHEAARRIH